MLEEGEDNQRSDSESEGAPEEQRVDRPGANADDGHDARHLTLEAEVIRQIEGDDKDEKDCDAANEVRQRTKQAFSPGAKEDRPDSEETGRRQLPRIDEARGP